MKLISEHEGPGARAEMESLRREHSKEIKVLTTKLKEAQTKLKQMVRDVLNPVLKDIEMKDSIIAKQAQEGYQASEDLRILNAIIKLPQMCQEF